MNTYFLLAKKLFNTFRVFKKKQGEILNKKN